MHKRNEEVDIVIVEDSPTQAEGLRYILEKRGFNVSVHNNGKEALDQLKKRVEENTIPDIIVTDVIMPEMDGYELCKAIRATEQLKDLPVILVTSLSDPTDVIRGLEVGADNFITKPYEE